MNQIGKKHSKSLNLQLKIPVSAALSNGGNFRKLGCSSLVAGSVTAFSLQAVTSAYEGETTDPMTFSLYAPEKRSSSFHLGTKLPGFAGVGIAAGTWSVCRTPPSPPSGTGGTPEAKPANSEAEPSADSSAQSRNIAIATATLLVLAGAALVLIDGPLPFGDMAGASLMARAAALML